MEAFDFVFSLFGLVLGFSLAEVLSGFARALKRRRVVHLGWLTPLLGIFVMLDLISFWDWAWGVRTYIEPRYGVLFIGLVVSSLYYLAASIVFPAEFGDRDDFDAHYMQHRRQVLGAVAICNLIGQGWANVMLASKLPAVVLAMLGLYYVLLIVGIVTSSKRLSIAVLAILIGLYLFTATTMFFLPRSF